jgi:hypothetical protein
MKFFPLKHREMRAIPTLATCFEACNRLDYGSGNPLAACHAEIWMRSISEQHFPRELLKAKFPEPDGGSIWSGAG